MPWRKCDLEVNRVPKTQNSTYRSQSTHYKNQLCQKFS